MTPQAPELLPTETPMSDHVARFWQHLETEHVRIVIDIRRDHEPDSGVKYHWDGATFSNDVAKALVADRNTRPPTPAERPDPQVREANRSDAEEFCKTAFGPFGVELEPYVKIITELLDGACARVLAALTARPSDAAVAVQDTWFIDRTLPIMAMAGDIESDRVLRLIFRRAVTDNDRNRLIEVLNAGEAALALPPDEPARVTPSTVGGEDDMVLPCDVFLPPATIIRKGVKLSVLLLGIKVREKFQGANLTISTLPTIASEKEPVQADSGASERVCDHPVTEMATLDDVAAAVHDGRFPEGKHQINYCSFVDECLSGQQYCRRIAREVIRRFFVSAPPAASLIAKGEGE